MCALLVCMHAAHLFRAHRHGKPQISGPRYPARSLCLVLNSILKAPRRTALSALGMCKANRSGTGTNQPTTGGEGAVGDPEPQQQGAQMYKQRSLSRWWSSDTRQPGHRYICMYEGRSRDKKDGDTEGAKAWVRLGAPRSSQQCSRWGRASKDEFRSAQASESVPARSTQAPSPCVHALPLQVLCPAREHMRDAVVCNVPAAWRARRVLCRGGGPEARGACCYASWAGAHDGQALSTACASGRGQGNAR